MMMGTMAAALLVSSTLPPTAALDNGLGRTPVRGWNSWNHFGCGVSEALIHAQTEAFAKYLAPAGYEYMNLDDCWMAPNRTDGKQTGDPVKFPSGIANLSKFIHSKNLKFGLYSARCQFTCQHKPASFDFETIDANQYAEWEVDYLKLDNCGSCPNESYTTALKHYSAMGAALNKSGRAIFYMSEFGTEYGMLPGGHAGPHVGPGSDTAIAPKLFNTDRVGNDINPHWSSVIGLIDDDEKHAPFAQPGFFNDMDMLEVGNGMSLVEDESHMAMWCVLAAPLIVGCDMTKMTSDTLRILTAKGPLSVDQDKLGVQGTVCSISGADKAMQVWRKPLGDGSIALVALNRADNSGGGASISIDLVKCGHGGGDNAQTVITDIWTGKPVATVSNSSYTTNGIPLHGSVFLRLSKAAATSSGSGNHHRSYQTHAQVERVALACPHDQRIERLRCGGSGDNSTVASTVDGDTVTVAKRECEGQQSCSFLSMEVLRLHYECMLYV